MLKLIKIVASLVSVCLLSACASSMDTTAKTEEQNQKVKTAKINAQLGIAYLERHNIQRSKQKLLLALEQAPTIPETWYSMAYFLEATGNKDDASIYYQKAIAVAPKRGDAQNNYGTFLCRNGDYRGAVEHFMVAVKDPTYLDPADAYENAGLCALKIPDKTMAAKYFALALQQDPARTVSENKLRDLNKYLAMNGSADESVETAPEAAAFVPPTKRIAYNSLKQRHQEEENEDDANSGLVKVPDVLKAKQVAAATVPAPIEAPAPITAPIALAAASTESPLETLDEAVIADAAKANAVPVPIKAVYSPPPKVKQKVKASKIVTAKLHPKAKFPNTKKTAIHAKAKLQAKAKLPAKATLHAKAKLPAKATLHAKAKLRTKAVAMTNPLTKEKFQVERVILEPLPGEKVALKTKVKPMKTAKLAAKKHKVVASVKPRSNIKIAHAATKKQMVAANTKTAHAAVKKHEAASNTVMV